MARTAAIFVTCSPPRSAQTRLSILLQPVPELVESFSNFLLDSLKFRWIDLSVFGPLLRKEIIFDLGLGP